VEPRFRHCGIGGDLLDAMCVVLRATGCVTIEAIAIAGSDGSAFARRIGATVGDELADDVLEFAALDRLRLEALRVPPAGYGVRSWTGLPPDDLVDSYAAAKLAIADAPNNYAPRVPAWSAALVRQAQEARAGRGAALWVEAAVPTGTNVVAAFTEIEVIETKTAANQVDTVVLRDHRRRGLATTVKAALLLRLHAARPDLLTVGVTCGVSNVGMRAVNHRLGFREEQRRTLYRLML
jgi:RimJ/RimL family protein N-acetyltransferase